MIEKKNKSLREAVFESQKKTTTKNETNRINQKTLTSEQVRPKLTSSFEIKNFRLNSSISKINKFA